MVFVVAWVRLSAPSGVSSSMGETERVSSSMGETERAQ